MPDSLKQYRRRQVIIHASQVLLANIEKVSFWCAGDIYKVEGKPAGVVVPTLEGTIIADIGDFVVKRGDGSFWAYTPEEFARKFESIHSQEVKK